MKKILLSIIVILSFSITISAQSFTCGDTIYDVDGNAYPTVLIGTQCWMAKNLNVGVQVTSAQTDNGVVEKICFNHSSANCAIYGGLYQWNEVMQYVTTERTQGICPDGWYVPAYNDYDILFEYLGGASVAGGEMKEAGTSHWQSPNTGATNSSGFTALPSGHWDYQNNTFADIGYNTFFRTSTLTDTTYPGYSWSVYLQRYSAGAGFDNINNPYGYSVRCICDGTTNIKDEILEKVLIYPNPTTGFFTVEIGNYNKSNTLEIYNWLGESVLVSGNFNKRKEIDLSNFPKGVYLVKIADGRLLYSGKIVVQ